VLSFGIAAFYAGVGGALLRHYLQVVSVEEFTILKSIEFLGMVIIGGLGSIMGSILGTIFMVSAARRDDWLVRLIRGTWLYKTLDLRSASTSEGDAVGTPSSFPDLRADGLAHPGASQGRLEAVSVLVLNPGPRQNGRAMEETPRSNDPCSPPPSSGLRPPDRRWRKTFRSATSPTDRRRLVGVPMPTASPTPELGGRERGVGGDDIAFETYDLRLQAAGRRCRSTSVWWRTSMGGGDRRLGHRRTEALIEFIGKDQIRTNSGSYSGALTDRPEGAEGDQARRFNLFYARLLRRRRALVQCPSADDWKEKAARASRNGSIWATTTLSDRQGRSATSLRRSWASRCWPDPVHHGARRLHAAIA